MLKIEHVQNKSQAKTQRAFFVVFKGIGRKTGNTTKQAV